MEMEKAKKRGRPAQLLQIAELHAFVEFLEQQEQLSDLQSQVLKALNSVDCNFEGLTQTDQVLVKEALKPYREHLKLKLLFEELNNLPLKTEYEQKIVDLYQDDQKGNLDLAERNILKTMCTRYYRFKAQQLKLKDLELYLSQIQKKDEGKKRKAENQLKFELGGAVLAAFKKLNKEIPEDRSKVTNSIVNNANFWKKVSKTKIYSAISTKESTYFEDIELFIKVIDGLASYSYDGQQLFEYEILKQKKLDKK
ncbi:hypothetical protein [Acinetobacter haemolyticus]|uniref:hypothetical protein n=1 Tax=Acinetobacter haemolyticus TaxID=29430 RepID=UPI000E57D817|nr:hypothetical protein [Acinetobacter haemolyticus]NAR58643.1 hypothetical protein [Acinetobacter haemolyticus]NAR81089.1 hypothetical protein [Acinetobacter haemolyticus]QDJ93855.1 hypothetical protein AhaeAN54_017770 [Acinetobacter haemolyticus]